VSAAGDRYDYLGYGLIEEMTTELGCLRPEHFAVIARTSAMQFDDLEERRAEWQDLAED
jgi:TolB-like protein